MGSLIEERKITLFVSPSDLRRLIAKMERDWKRMRPGDSLVVDVHSYESFILCIAIDQQKMINEYGQAGDGA